MPQEYFQASKDFDAFLAETRDVLGLATRHQTYTVVQAVLLVFRRRLTVADGLAFASVLPPVLRAIFVADWDISESPQEFEGRATLTSEVKAFRQNHNFAPDTAIEDVAGVLRRHVDEPAFDMVLEQLSTEAAAYWSVPEDARDSIR